MQPRGFVRAVLVPHRGKNPELREARHPADQLENALILVGLQPMTGDEFGGDLRLVHEALIREIVGTRKGLLWRNFLMSRALRVHRWRRPIAHRGQIGFKSQNPVWKAQIAWTTSPKPHTGNATTCMLPPRASSRGGRPGPATISRPI